VEEIAEIFEAEPIDIGGPRYNIPPTQPMLTVRSAEGHRELRLVRWGLIPWWAKPDEAKKIGSRCIQARAETVPRTAAFRDAFKRHRCLVVVDGFFEWKTLPDGKRVPYLARKSQRTPFAIAGLWDTWRPAPDEERIESCTVVTTKAAGQIRDLHDRMPLVLTADEWNTWLSGTTDDAEALLKPERATLERRARELVVIPVSTHVNNVKNDDPTCIEPIQSIT
jgi:putative SOS response-associated peptidase YedK